MRDKNLIALTTYDQEPSDMSETEARTFWDTHAVTDEYLGSMPTPAGDDAPDVETELRGKYVAIHVRRDVFERARVLARRRGVRVDELLQQLVEQGLVASDEPVPTTGS